MRSLPFAYDVIMLKNVDTDINFTNNIQFNSLVF